MALNFEDKLRQAKERFGTFQEKRKTWDEYFRREAATILAPEIEPTQEGIDYRTADLEKATFDWVDSLTTNPTILDLAPVSEAQADKETGRDILMWLHRGWELENPGRSWDRAVGLGQTRHGLKVMQQTYKPPKEPKLADDLSPEEYTKAREKAMRNRRYPFGWRDCDIYGCYWLGDETREEGADFFAYEVEIPLMEAEETYRKEGKKLACNLGKTAWVGQDEAIDNPGDKTLNRVRVVTIDARNLGEDCDVEGCEHPKRKICVYICGEDQGPNEETLYEEYDSPFPGCSFHVIPGRMTTERSPDARFRPTILPLYVEAQWVNYLTTQLATMARKDYGPNNLYIDGAQADPRHVSEGVKDGMVEFKMGEEGNLPWVPGDIKRVPNSISPHIITLIQMHQERMLAYMPNRYLTGNADVQASNATGTAFLQQAQQASLPANTLLAASDYIILRSRRYVIHAIKKWGLTEAAPTKYYAVMSGNNSGVQVKGKQPRAGEVFYVTADSINLDFDLNVITKSETLMEQSERWRIGKDMFITGVYTPEQLIRAAGIDDVEGQKEDLRAAGIRADFYQDEKLIRRAYLLRRISSRTGVDVANLAPAPDQAGQPAASGGVGGTTHIGPMLNQQQEAQQRSTRDVAMAAQVGVPGPAGGSNSTR